MNGKRWGIGTAAAAVLLFTGGGAIAQQTQPVNPPITMAPITETERQFIIDAARGSAHEVELGEMARLKAQRNPVKQFGERMVQDHGKAAQELEQLARAKGVRVEHVGTGNLQPTAERLAKVSPAQFDREYVNAMVEDHEEDLAKFRQMSQTAQDPEIRDWVTRALPTLEDHLATIKAIQGSMTGAVR
jgi:putative membrane protein